MEGAGASPDKPAKALSSAGLRSAAMFVDGGRAWLGIGALQASARRKGGQGGLLARIAGGLKQGMRWFAIAYERANWTL